MHTPLKSILYVEDDLHVRTTAKLVLEVLGKFDVHDCGSGREALAAAREFHPDLILLDMMMPDIDGVHTLEMLRRMPHLADTPALFVTSRSAPDDVARYMEAGAFGVIAKPVIPLRLSEQINTLWKQHC